MKLALNSALGLLAGALLATTPAGYRQAEAIMAIEDVSRHNAVDTVRGFMAVHGVTGAGHALFTTGRMTAELVLKAAESGIPVLISRNGTTTAGCEVASRVGMMLIGRAAKSRFICYVGADRLTVATPENSAMRV